MDAGVLSANRSFYERYHQSRWKARFTYDTVSKRNVARYVLRKSGFQDGGLSILDIGFGFGLILFMFDRSDSIAGVELSEPAVKSGEMEATRLGFVRAEFKIYPGHGKLSFARDSFDLIVCSHVLEHVPDDQTLIAEIHRLLKPGGLALINIPINEEHFDDPRHTRKYKTGTFLLQLEQSSLSVVFSYEGDRLWNLFGWFFEKEYHKTLPVVGFVISSGMNVFFSLLPFCFAQWIEKVFLSSMKPRQLAVCATKVE